MIARTKQQLTARQREILDWIKGFIREHTIPPTVREIGADFDIKSSTVFDHLKALEAKGYISRDKSRARALFVEEEVEADGGFERCECEEIPIKGCIAAGGPIDSVEDNLGTVPVANDVLRGRGGYALRVQGQSMIEAGINDGDYVIVRKQETAKDGDIVVALVGGESTLKKFYREGDGYRLEPANSEMAPIHVREGDFLIQGKVIGVMRTFGE
jgi:repressor LexA